MQTMPISLRARQEHHALLRRAAKLLRQPGFDVLLGALLIEANGQSQGDLVERLQSIENRLAALEAELPAS